MDFSHSTILVIDDSLESRSLICTQLTQAGYGNILEAPTPQEAFDILIRPQNDHADRGSAVDLILLASDLLEVDGVASCDKLKASAQTADIPILIITTAGKDSDLQQALEQGALDFISKPIKALELQTRLKTALLLKAALAKSRQLARELAAAKTLMQRAALSDGLTGLANRRYFDEFFAKEWRRCRREQESIALCLVDIDFFKAYNDAYGHHQGDECLKKVASILATSVKRPGDLVARYDGKKFAIALSGTTDAGGCAVAKRVMATLAARNIPHAHSKISDRLTLSFGIAMLTPRATTSVLDLMSQAERALFEAKNLGRNRISCSCLKGPTQP